jgi:hypothetical protein
MKSEVPTQGRLTLYKYDFATVTVTVTTATASVTVSPDVVSNEGLRNTALQQPHGPHEAILMLRWDSDYIK